MQITKLIQFGLLSIFTVLSMISCHDHDENNEVTIEIIKPVDGSKASNAKAVEIHIKFTATTELHGVEVLLHPESSPNNKIIDYDKHSHEKLIEFKDIKDLSSFPAGTKFSLITKSCKDEDCTASITKNITFTN